LAPRDDNGGWRLGMTTMETGTAKQTFLATFYGFITVETRLLYITAGGESQLF